MSKASRQSITLLAVIQGCIITISEYKLTDEFIPTVLYAKQTCDDVILHFPESGDVKKNTQWAIKKIHELNDLLTNDESIYTMRVLVSLMTHIITDLMQKIKSKEKLKILQPLEEVIFSLSDFIDTGDAFKAYEKADIILKEVYSALDFSF